MRFPIFRVLSFLLAIAGMALLPPLAAALLFDEGAGCTAAFSLPAALALTAAMVFRLLDRATHGPLEVSGAFAIVGGAWAALCFFGALPLWLSGALPHFTDAVFESFSGFTTTGASVIADVESLPRCVNLWRCETHWLGGMGVIALAVALVPLLGSEGFRLVKAETTGPEKGRVTPRIASTAKAMWLVYMLLTTTQAALLRLSGLDWFDAICHALSTLGTGGFSTRNGSVAAFANPAAEWICTAFMLLAAVNFALYYRLATGKAGEVRRNSELRAFLFLTALATAAVALFERHELGGVAATLRHSAFQVASIISTTGFMTADYAVWTPGARLVIFALFFIGGCAGSTGGGIKVIRWTLLAKQLRNEFRRILHPREVTTLSVDGVPGREELIPPVASFIFLYLLLVFATALAGALAGLSPVEALTGALSMVGNIGPAFGGLGPTANYAAIPGALKWWYAFAMLVGRLEIYTLLILVGRIFLSARKLLRRKRGSRHFSAELW